jgi:hypothetical protein
MGQHCTDHPQAPALSMCHACGKPYCRACLREAGDYYYCSAPPCAGQGDAAEQQRIRSAGHSAGSLDTDCTACGSQNRPGAAHCARCGALLPAADPAVKAARAAAGRRAIGLGLKVVGAVVGTLLLIGIVFLLFIITMFFLGGGIRC